MTYRELFYKATRLIDKGDITLGEYEEMTKPLDREIEQKPILEKLRAEIEQKARPNESGGRGSGKSIRYGLYMALEIIDKYRAESEVDK